jgi:hypothetical protein
MNLSWITSVINKLTSPSALKTESKILGIAAGVSTNPEVKAELTAASKAIGAISEVNEVKKEG